MEEKLFNLLDLLFRKVSSYFPLVIQSYYANISEWPKSKILYNRQKSVSTSDNPTEKINPFHLPTDKTWCSTQWTLALGRKKNFVMCLYHSKQINIMFNERSCISSFQGIPYQTAFLQILNPAIWKPVYIKVCNITNVILEPSFWTAFSSWNYMAKACIFYRR